MKNFLFTAGMVVVIVGACVSIYDRAICKKDGSNGRVISLFGVALAAFSMAA